jgi:hypothetical protein
MPRVGAAALLLAFLANGIKSAETATAGATEVPKFVAMIVHESDRETDVALRKALHRSGFRWIACRTVAGDMHRSVLFVPLANHAALDAMTRGINDFSSVRTLLFALSESLSYNTSHIPLSRATAYSVSLAYVRRGTTDGYVAEQKLAADLLRRSAVQDEEFIAYTLEFGGEPPAFLFLTPLRSLADLDIDLSGQHENLFTPEQDRHRADVLKDSVRLNESMLLVVDPAASNPPRSFGDDNRAFWRNGSHRPTP